MQINPDNVKIKRWREERSWSQEHLAAAAGISLRTIQRIENGDGASRESIMALASAFNVDVIALTVNTKIESEEIAKKEKAATSALRLAFLINLASYIFGLITFTVISASDGPGGYTMLQPALWWGVGLAGLGLTLVIVELTVYFKHKA